MMDIVVSSNLVTVRRESLPLPKSRFGDISVWKKVSFETFLWTMVGCVLIVLLQKTAPGYPVFVVTESIPTGLYWLERWPTAYKVNDYFVFEFKPENKQLKERYAPNRENFTKKILATEGWIINADASGEISACPPPLWGGACLFGGRPKNKDSKGRPMSSWLTPNSNYTIMKNEAWAFGPHKQSLDSRYYGPVKFSEVKGKAYPLFFF